MEFYKFGRRIKKEMQNEWFPDFSNSWDNYSTEFYGKQAMMKNYPLRKLIVE